MTEHEIPGGSERPAEAGVPLARWLEQGQILEALRAH